MIEREFIQLSNHLSSISHSIPLRWGKIQNDDSDKKINMFNCHSFYELNEALKGLDIETQTYFQKRWFLWKCSQCDEFLFYNNEGVNPNPNIYDQSWDFEFFGREDWRFDLKGTVVPRTIREITKGLYPEPEVMIKFFYEQQSKGVRNHLQNRLFLIHQAHRWQDENNLRANFGLKQTIFSSYSKMLRNNPTYKFFKYKNNNADIIYVTEGSDGKIVQNFASSILN